MTHETILFVDDEPHILEAMTRQLRKTFRVKTATSGSEALTLIRTSGPFAVIVSDLRMPEMDGITFLKKVRNEYPDSIRIILSGTADLSTAIEAVNSGQVFRFLTKPCSLNALVTTLTLATRQYQLVIGERELLDKTLKGSIAMLSELLSLTNARAFSRGRRIKNLVSTIADRIGLQPLWQYEVAALVCQVGCIAVPTDILKKVYFNEALTTNEKKLYDDHPRIGAQLIGKIPRLENVAIIVRNQLLEFTDFAGIDLSSERQNLTIGSQILNAALDYDLLLLMGVTHHEAVKMLYSEPDRFNPNVLTIIEEITPQFSTKETIDLFFDDLIPGMVAAENIEAKNGTLIIEKDQEISWPVLQGLQNFIDHIGIREPIRVYGNDYIEE